MNAVVVLLGLSSAAQLIVAVGFTVTSFRANIESDFENLRVFSGESLTLTCSIPDGNMSSWRILWFRGSESLTQSGRELKLRSVHVRESGKISCQGERDTIVGVIRTQRSLPVKIHVDGGWAILQAAPLPGLVGDSLQLSCRLRGKAPVHETIFYKEEDELVRLNGHKLDYTLTNLTLNDAGMYSCRVSWDMRRQTHSVASVYTYVHILEVLSQPVLEILTDNSIYGKNKMKLICHTQYHARAPAPPVHFYFYRNTTRMGTSKSNNYDLVTRSAGQYSCRVTVPQLGLEKWSEPTSYGEQASSLPDSHYLKPVCLNRCFRA